LAHEALRRAGKRIRARGPRALAGIEHGEAQRLVVVQQRAQIFAAHPAAAPQVIFHEQHAVLLALVENAVADKMKNVKLAAAQTTLQRPEIRGFELLQHHELFRLQNRQRLFQIGPFLLDVERRIVGGAGNHHEDFQRRLGFERADALRQFQIAHHRRFHRQNKKTVERRHVKKFPRQIGKLRRIQAHAQPQTGALTAHLIEAAAPTREHLAVKNRFEKPASESFSGVHLRRIETAHAPPRPADFQIKVFQLQLGKRQTKTRFRLSGRRVQNPRRVFAGRAFDEQVKIEIIDVSHYQPRVDWIDESFVI